MPHRIRAITLDLDDTLWPVDPVIERAEKRLHAWCEEHAPGVAEALPPAQFALYRRALATELPAIAHDYTALRLEALRRALAQYGGDPRLAPSALDVFLAARNEIELFPDALEALRRLTGRYRVVALSNGNADVARIGIGEYFAAVVNARSVGCSKPDARIFHAACACLDLRPEEVLHVGDDPDLDVRGAAAAGKRSAWINRDGRRWAGEPVDMVEFRDLLALCDWLRV
ncbi:MAG: HAD family hydrolase [Betaproteobacteria bacterium]|nr:MAG: HAD family hydrolase [Betaproteobacteria bacterium]